MRNKLTVGLLSTALMALLGLVILCKLNRYRDDLRLRLDPLETRRLADRSAPLQDGFWLIGDSRAAGWEVDQLDFLALPVSNCGIGGQTSRQVLERFRNDLDIARPSCILIQVGINDMKGIGLLGDGSITRNCTGTILEILRTCEEQDINAIYSAIFPPGDIELLRRPFWKEAVTDSLRMVNRTISQYCLEKGFLYLDTYKLLESQTKPGRAASEYQADFLHINTGGYQLISQAFQDLLRESNVAWASQLLK